ncbi:SHOCT domain-containing protein [Streptomyces sp. SHP 1-2]|uniref:SHOCT domain-containing protein n=1 Tax=Streptomyces sp. SHP 1-2 TaxID=2769489 RepID=UPI0022373ECB|nr:SHOCT domain-containing protein [Streptomyces sp. SHP 1-2]MCW5252130.1 SHOCT domain-containing protein [Streptomyces sp. SHP 1-2]
MNTLAHVTGGGPGPGTPLVPPVRVPVVAGVVALPRRAGRAGVPAVGCPMKRSTRPPPRSAAPFDSGGIDEDEYGRRHGVLDEGSGRTGRRREA